MKPKDTDNVKYLYLGAFCHSTRVIRATEANGISETEGKAARVEARVSGTSEFRPWLHFSSDLAVGNRFG
jgi:hypothetical protein